MPWPHVLVLGAMALALILIAMGVLDRRISPASLPLGIAAAAAFSQLLHVWGFW